MAVLSFDSFKNMAQDAGYTERVKQEQNNYVLFTNNNVKCEIKKRAFTFGWLRKPWEIELIKETFESAGYKCLGSRKKNDLVSVPLENIKDVLTEFFNLVGIIEGLEEIVARERSQAATKVFPKEIAEREIFLKIVKRYKHAIDNEDQNMLDIARKLLDGDDIDHLITIGHSTKRTTNETYREHIVPCVMIHNELIEMYMRGSSLTEMGQFLKQYLAVVLIHPSEAEKMDIELGLRTTMPENWKWGDSIFARLNAAEVKII